jgi:hypothetical protein
VPLVWPSKDEPIIFGFPPEQSGVLRMFDNHGLFAQLGATFSVVIYRAKVLSRLGNPMSRIKTVANGS